MNKLILSLLPTLISVNLVAATSDLEHGGQVKGKYLLSEEMDQFQAEATFWARKHQDNGWFEARIKMRTADATRLSIHLDRALVGYSLLANDTQELYIEGGRCPTSYVFASELQHAAPFSGAHLGYRQGAITAQVGASVVDGPSELYALLGRVQMAFDSVPLTVAYSATRNGADYLVSQATVEYKVGRATAYVGYLINHSSGSDNQGGYAGIKFGEIKSAKDFKVDVCHKRAQLNLVPFYDFGGVAIGGTTHVKTSYAVTDALALDANVTFIDTPILELAASYRF